MSINKEARNKHQTCCYYGEIRTNGNSDPNNQGH